MLWSKTEFIFSPWIMHSQGSRIQCVCVSVLRMSLTWVHMPAQMGNLRAPAEPRVSTLTRHRIDDRLLTLGTNQWLEDTDSIHTTTLIKTHPLRWTLSYHHFPIGLWLTPAWWSAGVVTWYLLENAESMPRRSQALAQDNATSLLSTDKCLAVLPLVRKNINHLNHKSLLTYLV